jgi:isopentenyl-diphosphate delta-isomerase
MHNALPELSEAEVDTSVEFLDQSLPLPLFISCMTGGSEGGFRANRDLAQAAQELGLPVGLGSMRVMLDQPDLFPHFDIKPLAPDVPVLANMGGVQIRDRNHDEIFSLVDRLNVQSLVVHLNPGQELFQPEGDRDFRGILSALVRLVNHSPVPIIVKETGFGIHPSLVQELIEEGVSYVDLAGAGGTNWISVESYRLPEADQTAAGEFEDWGLPTALLLATLFPEDKTGFGLNKRILASGGLRSGMDLAKALVLGAHLVGMALPFIRKVTAGGVEAVITYVKQLEKTLRSVMLLTGSRNLDELRRQPYWMDPSFEATLRSFRRATELSIGVI